MPGLGIVRHYTMFMVFRSIFSGQGDSKKRAIFARITDYMEAVHDIPVPEILYKPGQWTAITERFRPNACFA